MFSLSLNSPVARAAKPAVIVATSPKPRPGEDMNRHAAQMAKLDIEQDGGENLLAVARKRVEEEAVPALILRVALAKGQPDGSKGVITAVDALAPLLAQLLQPQDGAEEGSASAAQRSVLDLAEAWFSIEGGLSAAAERMGDLGKVVPKVMHA